MEYQVTWTGTFSTTVRLKPGQTLEDAIEAINIPEDGDTSYQCGTFDVSEVEDASGKRLKRSEWGKVVGITPTHQVNDYVQVNVDGKQFIGYVTECEGGERYRVYDPGANEYHDVTGDNLQLLAEPDDEMD